MPIVDGNYVAPTWSDNNPPPINAEELQAICNTLEGIPNKYFTQVQTLQAAVAQAFGLSASAVPNDVFNILKSGVSVTLGPDSSQTFLEVYTMPSGSNYGSGSISGNGVVLYFYTNNSQYYYLYTNDGENFTVYQAPFYVGNSQSMGYFNGYFIICNSRGNKIAYSQDGIDWTQVVVNSSANFSAPTIFYFNNLYIIISGGNEYYSSDLQSWSTISFPNTNFTALRAATNGEIVILSNALSAYGMNYLYSEDGLNWNPKSISKITSAAVYFYYWNGVFYALNGNLGPYYLTSTDGSSWVQQSAPVSNFYGSLISSENKIILIANGSNATPYISEDGLSWEASTLEGRASYNYPAYLDNKNLFLIINTKYANALASVSSDFSLWNFGGTQLKYNLLQVESGSYTGTGTNGSGNSNTITFKGKPIFGVIGGINSTTSVGSPYYVGIFFGDVDYLPIFGGSANSMAMYRNNLTVSGNTISWYSDNSDSDQLNISNKDYYYTFFTL